MKTKTDYLYMEKKGIKVYLYPSGIIEIKTMIDNYHAMQLYSIMDFSINDALYMFKDYLNTI
jgi:hypothetical protein